MYKKSLLSIFVLINVIVFNDPLKAQTSDDVLNLLINKNLIKKADVDSIRAEYTKKQQGAAEKPALLSVTAKSTIHISGYTQIRFQSLQEAAKPDGMDIRRSRLDFRGQVSPKWEYRLQLDFASVLPLAPKITDAYAGFKPYYFLNLQVGQYKIPFSLENLTSSSSLESIERSQVVENLVARNKDVIGNQNGRDIGLQIYGSFLKLKEKYLFDYFASILNGAGINATETNEEKDFAGRLVIHLVEGLDIGGSLYSGYDKIGNVTFKNQTRNRVGGEASYTRKNFSVKGEYIEGKDAGIKKAGYYIQASYYIIPKRIQFLAKYDTFDPDKAKINNITTFYIGGINFYFNDWAKCQLNYTYKAEEGQKINNDVVSTQVQISF